MDILLGVDDYEGTDWVQYDDSTILVLAKHEFGHALGLEHSNDYVSGLQQQNDLSSFLKDNNPLTIAGYGIFAVIVFLAVSWLLNKK